MIIAAAMRCVFAAVAVKADFATAVTRCRTQVFEQDPPRLKG